MARTERRDDLGRWQIPLGQQHQGVVEQIARLAGPLEGAQTLSMILAGGLMAGLAARFSIPRLFVGGIAGLAVCVGLLSVAPGPWTLLIVMFAGGWFVIPVQASTMTIVRGATRTAGVVTRPGPNADGGRTARPRRNASRCWPKSRWSNVSSMLEPTPARSSRRGAPRSRR